MQTLYKKIEKLPDSEKVVYFFDKNGIRKEKTVKVTDRYLVTNARGDSFAATKQQLSKMGIGVSEPKVKVEEIVEDSEEEDVDPTQTVAESSPNSNNKDGVNNNG